MVTQGRERLDMLVVPPPAAGDDVVVEVSETFLKPFDPGAEFVPMLWIRVRFGEDDRLVRFSGADAEGDIAN